MKRHFTSLFCALVLFSLLALAGADDKVVIRDRLGRTVGTAITEHGRTIFRDRLGRTTGTVVDTGSKIVIRDRLGRTIGTAR